jgi:hypothetical protein
MIYHHGIVSFVNKVPVISGGSLRVSWPLTEDYCKNILLLHWRNLSEIKSDDISWSDKLQEFLLNDSCPNFVKADIERAKLGDNNVNLFDEEKVDDDDDEQPEWVDLVQPCADFHVDLEFKYDGVLIMTGLQVNVSIPITWGLIFWII